MSVSRQMEGHKRACYAQSVNLTAFQRVLFPDPVQNVANLAPWAISTP